MSKRKRFSDSELDRRRNLKLSWGSPASVCDCAHLGDGPDSNHEGHRGHGRCLVRGCPCGFFTWHNFTPEYAAALDACADK